MKHQFPASNEALTGWIRLLIAEAQLHREGDVFQGQNARQGEGHGLRWQGSQKRNRASRAITIRVITMNNQQISMKVLITNNKQHCPVVNIMSCQLWASWRCLVFDSYGLLIMLMAMLKDGHHCLWPLSWRDMDLGLVYGDSTSEIRAAAISQSTSPPLSTHPRLRGPLGSPSWDDLGGFRGAGRLTWYISNDGFVVLRESSKWDSKRLAVSSEQQGGRVESEN